MYGLCDNVLFRVFRSRWQSLVHPSLKSLQTDPISVYEKPEELQQNNSQFSDVRSVDLLLQEHCNPKEKWKYSNGNPASYHTNPSKAFDLNLIGCNRDLKSKQGLDLVNLEMKNLTEKWVIGKDQFMNGVQAANKCDYCKAIDFWKKSAKLGYSKSSFNLGLCYDLGIGVERNIKQAVKYYTEAADQNHSKALFNLAILQMHGEVADGSQGKSNAISLLHTAAKLGLPVAKTWLGVHYIEDCNDVSRAVELFTEAAKHKEPAAKFYLGFCYLKGMGIEQCKEKASSLFAEAAKLGHVKAKEMVGDQSTAEDSESETEFTDNNVYTSSDVWNLTLYIANQLKSMSEASSPSSGISYLKNIAETEELSED